MTGDWRDDRISELEAQVAHRDARIAELEGQVSTLTAQVAHRDARIAELEGQVSTLTAQVALLTKQVAELMEKLGRNSRNSHLPPSSDGPGMRGGGASGKGKGKPGARKRGGQPGHGGSFRTLLPVEEVNEIVDVFPSHCEGCADELPEVKDPDAHRYQQTEVPPITPHTTEWRCHEVACARCKHRTRAPHDPEQIPASPFGPRLMALIAFLTGVYHVSRRKTVVLLWELLGVRISLGALSAIEARVSEAIAPAVEDVLLPRALSAPILTGLADPLSAMPAGTSSVRSAPRFGRWSARRDRPAGGCAGEAVQGRWSGARSSEEVVVETPLDLAFDGGGVVVKQVGASSREVEDLGG